MGQRLEVAATTDIRRVLHALRPLALLGGFVVMWWCLATGAAQADQGPHRDLGTTPRALAATADRATHRPVTRAADQVRAHRATPARVVAKVRQHVSPDVSQTRAIVQSTPAGPIATEVSDTVRSHLTQVVDQTRATLDSTPVGGVVIPELEGASDVEEYVTEVGESSTLQGESASVSLVASGISAALSDFTAASSTAPADQAHAAPRSPRKDGSNTPLLRSSGSPSASSLQSGSGFGPGAGLCETGLDITLAAAGTAVPSLAGWHPAGPAYPPVSSPD